MDIGENLLASVYEVEQDHSQDDVDGAEVQMNESPNSE